MPSTPSHESRKSRWVTSRTAAVRFSVGLATRIAQRVQGLLLAGPSSARELYGIYHAYDPLVMLKPDENHWLEDRHLNYRHVADVKAHLEEIFRLTNHFDEQDERGWLGNQEVVWHATDAPIRSTSVGDVISAYRTGQAWLIMSSELREFIQESSRTKKP